MEEMSTGSSNVENVHPDVNIQPDVVRSEGSGLFPSQPEGQCKATPVALSAKTGAAIGERVLDPGLARFENHSTMEPPPGKLTPRNRGDLPASAPKGAGRGRRSRGGRNRGGGAPAVHGNEMEHQAMETGENQYPQCCAM